MHPTLQIGKTYTVIQPEDVMGQSNYEAKEYEIYCKVTQTYLIKSMMMKRQVKIKEQDRNSNFIYRIHGSDYAWTPEMFKETFMHYCTDVFTYEELML